MAKESAQIKTLQAVWLDAFKQDIVIPCADNVSATRLRFMLYNAVKPIRKRPETNPELAEALEALHLRVIQPEPGKYAIQIAKSGAVKALLAFAAKRGLDATAAPETMDDIDLAAQASMDKLAAAGILDRRAGAVEKPEEPPAVANPYMTTGWRNKL